MVHTKISKGFTLVEVIMVMVILSILAIVAAPRFINFQSSAYKTVQKATIQAVNSTMSLGQVKAAVDGHVNGTISINEKNVCFESGYPSVKIDTSKCTAPDSVNFLALMDLDDSIKVVKKTDDTGSAVTAVETAMKKDFADVATIFLKIHDKCFVKVEKKDTLAKPVVTKEGDCGG
jgi:prepilin-type N-terminal cleavage/methylation domain-containing protein